MTYQKYPPEPNGWRWIVFILAVAFLVILMLVFTR